MAYGVMIPKTMAGRQLDSAYVSAKATIDVENGGVVVLGGLSTVRNEKDVFLATAPVAATDVVGIVYEPPIVLTDGKYKNINPDPRGFINVAGKVFGVYIITNLGMETLSLSVDAISGVQGVKGFAIPAAGSTKLVWSATANLTGLTLTLLETTVLIIGNERVVNNRFKASIK